MLRRSAAVVIAALLVLAACSSGAETGSEVRVAPLPPQATPPPTTAPFEEPTPPPPTPVDLASGVGITVEPTAPTAVPTAPPTETPVEEPTAVPQATAQPDPTPPGDATQPADPTPPTEPAPTEPAPTEPEPTATEAPPLPGAGAGAGDPGNAALVANGAEVYFVTCARCHGETGAGTFIASGLFTVTQRYSVPTLTNELVNGHPYTFGFADKLTADQIDAVVSYVLATF